MDCAPPANTGEGWRHGGAGAPAGRREECGAGVPLPGRGAEFTEGEVCERFGVKKRGGIRVNHGSRIIVLIDGADAPAPGGNAGRGKYLEFCGHGVDAQGRMNPDDVALANSPREGYEVLYFAKKHGRLRFEGLVECASTLPQAMSASAGRSPLGSGRSRWRATAPQDCSPCQSRQSRLTAYWTA